MIILLQFIESDLKNKWLSFTSKNQNISQEK